jgi:pSer/pThr/pTyr-binding forkhead associated (FHA) protein
MRPPAGSPTGPEARPQATRPRRVWLVCAATEPLPLSTNPVTIGRRSDVDVVLPHDTVSRLHAEALHEREGRVMIRNRSPNGFTVNGKQVDTEQELKPGDVIKIGPYVIRVTDQPGQGGDAAPTTYFRHDEEASDDDLRERLASARAEVEAQRRQLESEVWRGFATNRDLAESRKKLAELEEELERRGGEST